jgi:hypothetical protein
MRSLEAIQESLLDSILSGKGDLAFIKANGSIKAEHRLRVTAIKLRKIIA